MTASLEDWMTIGRIVGAQGLRGELRVYPETDFPERFLEPGDRWLLRPKANQPEPVELLSGRYLPKKNLYVIELAGIEDRDQADELRQAQLLVPLRDRPPLEMGEFHVLDLIGLPVIHQGTGEMLGEVVDVLSAGNDLLEVALGEAALEPTVSYPVQKPKDQRATVLVPFVYAIVPVVDLEQQRIEIIPPPGLLDLQIQPKPKKISKKPPKGHATPKPSSNAAQSKEPEASPGGDCSVQPPANPS